MDSNSVETVFNAMKSRFNYHYNLNEKQLDVISSLLSRKDTFCVLPTGFGKSDCFILPPLMLEEMTGMPHIAIVITPLRSLMKDMTLRLQDRNIKAACILRADEMEEETNKGLCCGSFSIVFASPEVMLEEKWRKVIRSKVYRERLSLFVCDEAHCIMEWGKSFRPAYKEVACIKNLVDVPLLVTTATTTSEMKQEFEELFEVDSLNTIAVVPDRPNIFFNFSSKSGMEISDELKWIRESMLSQVENCPKMIIYCQSIRTATDVYEYLVDPLLDIGRKSLIQLYHSEIYKETEGFITADFPKVRSDIRVLVSTIAFGMGVDIPDVRRVIHWGASKSVLSYWQEIGRCGRDRAPSEAFLYATKTSLDKRKVTEEMIEVCKDLSQNGGCIRLKMLQHLTIPDMDDYELMFLKTRKPCQSKCSDCRCALCICCCFCKTRCSCTIEEAP